MNNKGWGMSDLLWILSVIGVSLMLVSVLIKVSFKEIPISNDFDNSEIETIKPEEAPEKLEPEEDNVEIEVSDTNSYNEMEQLLKSTAEEYVSKYYSDSSVASVTISLNELEQAALVSSLHDPNDINVSCDGYVIYTSENKSYQPYLKCGSNYQTPGY